MLSRVADSLYWMSRYLERAEHTARLIDVNVVLMLDQSPAFATRRWAGLLASLHAELSDSSSTNTRMIVEALTLDRSNKSSIVAAITAARDNARQVREQISSEMWEQVNRLYLQISSAGIDEIWNAQPHAFFRGIMDGIHLFHGVMDATMGRGEGWHFMELGRFLERASNTAALLDVHLGEELGTQDRRLDVTDYLNWVGLLKSRTAFEAYCQVYSAEVRPDQVAEFLVLNAEFPQSIHFAATRMRAAAHAIGRATRADERSELERLAGRFQAELQFARIEELMEGDLHGFLQQIQHRCRQIHTTLHRIYIAPPIESLVQT
jgi:uncharacterized alpha-E superfamily protein